LDFAELCEPLVCGSRFLAVIQDDWPSVFDFLRLYALSFQVVLETSHASGPLSAPQSLKAG